MPNCQEALSLRLTIAERGCLTALNVLRINLGAERGFLMQLIHLLAGHLASSALIIGAGVGLSSAYAQSEPAPQLQRIEPRNEQPQRMRLMRRSNEPDQPISRSEATRWLRGATPCEYNEDLHYGWYARQLEGRQLVDYTRRPHFAGQELTADLGVRSIISTDNGYLITTINQDNIYPRVYALRTHDENGQVIPAQAKLADDFWRFYQISQTLMLEEYEPGQPLGITNTGFGVPDFVSVPPGGFPQGRAPSETVTATRHPQIELTFVVSENCFYHPAEITGVAVNVARSSRQFVAP